MRSLIMLGPAGLRSVIRDIGALVVIIGTSMVVPLLISLLYGEIFTAVAFLITALFACLLGGGLYRWFRDAGELKEQHALIIASAGWMTVTIIGALPFLLTAHLTPARIAAGYVPPGERYASSLMYLARPLHAWFESMSAYTTTGLTMSVHEPSIGKGLLFYRHFAQFIGGVGVVVLSLAVLRRPGGVSRLVLYGSESTGVKLRPTIVGTARAIWRVYIALTLMTFLYLVIGTYLILPDYGWEPTIFDAINHAMAGLSTGGFSTLDDSIAGYHSYGMELLHIPPMLLGTVSIPLYYRVVQKRSLRVLWADAQVRTLLILTCAGVPVLSLLLANERIVPDPVRVGLFQFISAISTTGWQTSNIGDWSSAPVLFLTTTAMIRSTRWLQVLEREVARGW